MSVTFYIAATDRMSWGRGTREWEAIAHAILHGGIGVKNIVLFQVTCPEGTVESDVSVNEMGSITAPAGSEVKDLDNMKATRMAEKFFDYKDEVDAMLYPDEDGGK
jgi:hypothetical protein